VLQLRDEELLADDVPLRPRPREPVGEPSFLFPAEHRVPAAHRLLAAKRLAVAAGVVGPILAVVEHRELHEKVGLTPARAPLTARAGTNPTAGAPRRRDIIPRLPTSSRRFEE
jgi:hypothetical protein